MRFALILFLLSFTVCLMSVEAVTDDGRVIIVNDDGTWKLREVDKSKEILFRGAAWGCSKEEAKKNEEGNELHDAGDILAFEDTLSGMKCVGAYVFTDDKMVRAQYRLSEEHINAFEHLKDFNKLGDLLTEKYGKPDRDEDLWQRTRKYDDHAEAIAMGWLFKVKEWKRGDTSITLIISASNMNISNVVEYNNAIMGKLEEAAKKKKAKDKF